jgi:hypothetical protein
MNRFILTFEWIWSQLSVVQATYHLNALSIVLGSFCLYLLYILVYGIFLCPTSHIPGPFLARFSSAYYYALLFGGSISFTVHELHKKYGTPLLVTY